MSKPRPPKDPIHAARYRVNGLAKPIAITRDGYELGVASRPLLVVRPARVLTPSEWDAVQALVGAAFASGGLDAVLAALDAWFGPNGQPQAHAGSLDVEILLAAPAQ